jgi:hypothetical protein
VSGDLADVVLRSAPSGRPSSTRVVPIAPRRRRPWAWGALPATVVAAAAAMLIAVITKPPRTTGEKVHRDSYALHARDSGTTASVAKAADDRPHGTVVLSVDPADDQTTYSVMEVPGEQEGASTSVVWIEEPSPGESGGVQ